MLWYFIIFYLLVKVYRERNSYGTYLRIHLETSRQSISDILYHYHNKWVRLKYVMPKNLAHVWQIVAINFVISYVLVWREISSLLEFRIWSKTVGKPYNLRWDKSVRVLDWDLICWTIIEIHYSKRRFIYFFLQQYLLFFNRC